MSERSHSALESAPVLAQIPHPNYKKGPASWEALGWSVLALVLGMVVTGALFYALHGEPPKLGYSTRSGFDPVLRRMVTVEDPPVAWYLVGLAAAFGIPTLGFAWLRQRMMAACGGGLVRGVAGKGRGGVLPACKERVSRRDALLCLLGPCLVITLLGLLLVLLRMSAGAPIVAFVWSSAVYDLTLGIRLLREPGCVAVDFRPEGLVLYGTARAQAPPSALRIWLTALIGGVGQVLGLCVLVFMFGVVCQLALMPRNRDFEVNLWLIRFYRRSWPPQPVPGGGWTGGGWTVSHEWDGRNLALALLLGPPLLATGRIVGGRKAAESQRYLRLNQEAGEARQLQRDLLPSVTPEVAGFEIASFFSPAREVSGDFFLFLPAPSGAARFVVGDVAGKGIPAAITASLAVGFLRPAHPALPLSDLLREASASLRAALTRRTRTQTRRASAGQPKSTDQNSRLLVPATRHAVALRFRRVHKHKTTDQNPCLLTQRHFRPSKEDGPPRGAGPDAVTPPG